MSYLASGESGSSRAAWMRSVITEPGEWVRYSTPDGAEYVAICLPAFTLETAHRDDDEQ